MSIYGLILDFEALQFRNEATYLTHKLEEYRRDMHVYQKLV